MLEGSCHGYYSRVIVVVYGHDVSHGFDETFMTMEVQHERATGFS